MNFLLVLLYNHHQWNQTLRWVKFIFKIWQQSLIIQPWLELLLNLSWAWMGIVYFNTIFELYKCLAICPFPWDHPYHLMMIKLCTEVRLINGSSNILVPISLKKCPSPDPAMCIPPSSLIASIPKRRSNPCSWSSKIRASICMCWLWSMLSLILPYQQHFRKHLKHDAC